MENLTGKIHSIETFGTVDGPGIRFVIFFQGCHLKCKYCHNRDTWDTSIGTKITVSELVEDIIKYKEYIEFSGGGVTATGGEPLLQPKFLISLFSELKKLGFHIALDTSGMFPITPEIKQVLDLTDLVLLDIKHIDEYGNEYWFARDLQKVLEYKDWRNFLKVLDKAKEACCNSRFNVDEQLVEVNKLSKRNNNAIVNIQDYKLSRYICYLIVQNADPSKEVVALGQTYFAVQTRKQEITEQEYDSLSDDEKRFYQRKLTRRGNYTLQKVASSAGVKNMAEFHNAGYRGLYNGETADDIFKRKKLRYREDILDNMNEDELVANLFRINQTKQKLLRDNVKGENNAKNVHYEVGKKVRKAIADIGGMMPENMPTPKKSLKELEKERKLLENKE